MKYGPALATLLVAGTTTVAGAQSMGTVTVKGVSMEVKSAVAVHTLSEVEFSLIPFVPTTDEIAKLQASDYMWVLLEKPSPDPKKWKRFCPYVILNLSWFSEATMGDPTKANLHIIAQSFGDDEDLVQADRKPGEFSLSLTGAIKEGQEVTVTSKGSAPMQKLDWDLKLKAKILLRPKKSK